MLFYYRLLLLLHDRLLLLMHYSLILHRRLMLLHCRLLLSLIHWKLSRKLEKQLYLLFHDRLLLLRRSTHSRQYISHILREALIHHPHLLHRPLLHRHPLHRIEIKWDLRRIRWKRRHLIRKPGLLSGKEL